jgi:hypothetical protein
MIRDDRRKADRQARIGLEDLEGRNLQSTLVGGAASSAPLIRPAATGAPAYDTTVWGRTDEGLAALKVQDGFSTIKGEFATIKGEFVTLKYP